MPQAQIRSIEFTSPLEKINPDSGSIEVKVCLEDGSVSSFRVATPDQPAVWIGAPNGFSFGAPVLFVARIDQEAVGEAVVAMSEDMSGFWLRYYKSTRASNGKSR